MSTLDARFDATMETDPEKGGWTYVVVPDSVALLGTGRSVKVSGTVDGRPVETSLLPIGGGRHMLPIKADVRKAIAKRVGDTVKVALEHRLDD